MTDESDKPGKAPKAEASAVAAPDAPPLKQVETTATDAKSSGNGERKPEQKAAGNEPKKADAPKPADDKPEGRLLPWEPAGGPQADGSDKDA